MIRIGIAGYGNIGRGVECNIKENDDMELVAIFTRRDPAQVKTQGICPVLNISELENWKDKIDVLVIAGGSATDLPEQTPAYSKWFNCLDTFDTHARIPEHFANVDAAAKEAGLNVFAYGNGAFSGCESLTDIALPDSIKTIGDCAFNCCTSLEESAWLRFPRQAPACSPCRCVRRSCRAG